MSSQQRRVMTAIEVCRTALGGHLERCDRCGHERNWFNSCRDCHCPKCQSLARAQWIEDRQAEILEVPYFHVVFTVPEEVAAIAYQNKAVVYGILFRATAETLRIIAADPKHLGAEIGFFAVLHVRCMTPPPQLRKCSTSSGLSTTGNFCGFFGAGIASSKVQSFFRETLLRNRSAAVAMRMEPGASFLSLVR